MTSSSRTSSCKTRPGRRSSRAARERLEALLALLGDDSPRVWESVRTELLQDGRATRAGLQRAARSEDPRTRSRARTLLTELERRGIVRRLVRYASRERIDLETGLFLLARLVEPALDPRPFQRVLDSLAAELLERTRTAPDELARVRAIANYLGRELGYGGSRGEYRHPDNIHLHRVIERKAGMPLSLSAIYLFVARRMGLRAALVPLPGHVMVRLYAGSQGLIFDPYHKGQRRTDQACRQYLEQHGVPLHALYLRDAGDRAMFRRQVANLSNSAKARGLRREHAELALVLQALDPRTGVAGPARGTGPTRGRRN